MTSPEAGHAQAQAMLRRWFFEEKGTMDVSIIANACSFDVERNLTDTAAIKVLPAMSCLVCYGKNSLLRLGYF